MRRLSRMPLRRGSRAGFTLIEISLVLLLFASAVGGLLSFFPVGLKLENNAISDSAQTMFGLHVLGQIEANAANINSWAIWEDDKLFEKAVLKNVRAGGKDIKVVEDELISDYLVKNAHIRYRLRIHAVNTPMNFHKTLRRAVIWATDRKDGSPEINSPLSVDLVYRGKVEDVLPQEGAQ